MALVWSRVQTTIAMASPRRTIVPHRRGSAIRNRSASTHLAGTTCMCRPPRPVRLTSFCGGRSKQALGERSHIGRARSPPEAGWQPARFMAWQPWIRGGYNYSSGDSNPDDDRHGTFFQVLPTARIYARTPFFNLMNSVDAFGELILRPSNRIALRTDLHSIRLARKNDLWYSGGGAFQSGTFGYNGRPSNGQLRLGTLYNVSGDIFLNRHVGLGLYYAYVRSHDVVRAIFPRQRCSLRLCRVAVSLLTQYSERGKSGMFCAIRAREVPAARRRRPT